MFLLHDGKTNEWTRRQAAWGLNWVKYKSGGDALHGRITTVWHKKKATGNSLHPRGWNELEVSPDTSAHMQTRCGIPLCLQFHFTNVIYCQLLGEWNILPLLFFFGKFKIMTAFSNSFLTRALNKHMYTHIMVQNSNQHQVPDRLQGRFVFLCSVFWPKARNPSSNYYESHWSISPFAAFHLNKVIMVMHSL